ncbi:alkyl hydroperoxide reductase subunit F [Acidocella facilis]|uniref:alkyl hydroperoxide reductase subunit F n=1 Tax=Acidocella facilis TaxID=525 RepID=UPI001F0C8C3F|nr:alkyl hydroperoxide reductase subunit F [Acidocella facilis]
MLDDSLKGQLKTYLARMPEPIELVASLDDGALSKEMHGLLEDISAQSEKITLKLDGADARVPSFEIRKAGAARGVRFAGLPMGHEFTSLVLALLQTGGYPPKIAPEVIAQIKEINGEFHFTTYFSQSCQNCPDVVQALNLLAILNPGITHVAVDGAAFQDEVKAEKVMAVPTIKLNGEAFGQGRMEIEQIIAKLDSGAVAREAANLSAKAAFEVLVVGAGPAGAAAAIYAARKGIRTGLLAERFGGQVLDTMAIENFISVPHTEGPKLAAALEQHTRDYEVDIMKGQLASAIVPPAHKGGLFEVKLASGASVKSKSLVLAPGARWRTMNVPGEAEYRNKGVAYCPHCDGPLFKGKRVAVIGGGNSGVEAAIDLAGIVSHVTLIEFDGQLRADAVLQAKLKSLPNASIITSAKTTEVHGDGEKVVGLSYEDRKSSEVHKLALDGIFVQIGLVPNTEWLKGALALTSRGEIEIDVRGETSLAGVFAAGDATIVPYKQIIIAAGEGAKAALSAFDYLIRLAPEVAVAAE